MPKYLVSAPRPDFQGAIVGVHFRDGAATVDPAADDAQRAALQYFQRAGYTMTAIDEPVDDAPAKTRATSKGAQS
ncbi:hypothetical protein ACWEPB_02735 [Kitasatospora cineracea]